MRKLRALLEGSFQARVLVPVVSVMVLLTAILMWMGSRRTLQQLQTDTTHQLETAEAVFKNWQQSRVENLLSRYEIIANDPHFKTIVEKTDANTFRDFLDRLIDQKFVDVNIVIVATGKGQLFPPVTHDPQLDAMTFANSCSNSIAQAVRGYRTVDIVRNGNSLFDIVCIPIRLQDGSGGDLTVGAVCFGVRNSISQEFNRLTHSELILVADGQVVSFTASKPGWEPERIVEIAQGSSNARKTRSQINELVLDGEHFLSIAGRLAGATAEQNLDYYILSSYEPALQTFRATQQVILVVSLTAILLGSLFVCILVGKVTRPLRELRDSAEAVGRGDFSRRVEVKHKDECGELAQVFNQMTENLQRSREELEGAQAELVETSRRAGMVEVATGVLHNVGNVLNSVNVASHLIGESLQKSKAANLPKLVALLQEHETDLGEFITRDPRGKQVPLYLEQLSKHLVNEQEAAVRELVEMQKSIQHIKEIVKAQQSYSKISGTSETLELSDLVEDAIRMSSSQHSTVRLQKELEGGLKVTTEKHKVLQILINLIRNGRQACESSIAPEKKLTIRTSNGGNRVRIAVTDNGIGITPENLNRIFAHGFTTKKDGHGFGLHSSFLAAKEMGGALLVHSDGLNQGATFILELPSGSSPTPADPQKN